MNLWRVSTTCRGRTPGLPPAGVQPRRWRCGCRARAALSDRGAGVLRRGGRDPPRGLVHRPEPNDATSRSGPLFVDMPSVLRGCVRAPPRAPRAGARRASPCSRCRCRSAPEANARRPPSVSILGVSGGSRPRNTTRRGRGGRRRVPRATRRSPATSSSYGSRTPVSPPASTSRRPPPLSSWQVLGRGHPGGPKPARPPCRALGGFDKQDGRRAD